LKGFGCPQDAINCSYRHRKRNAGKIAFTLLASIPNGVSLATSILHHDCLYSFFTRKKRFRYNYCNILLRQLSEPLSQYHPVHTQQVGSLLTIRWNGYRMMDVVGTLWIFLLSLLREIPFKFLSRVDFNSMTKALI